MKCCLKIKAGENIYTDHGEGFFMRVYSKFLDIIQKIYKVFMVAAMAVLTVTIIASVIWSNVLGDPVSVG